MRHGVERGVEESRKLAFRSRGFQQIAGGRVETQGDEDVFLVGFDFYRVVADTLENHLEQVASENAKIQEA